MNSAPMQCHWKDVPAASVASNFFDLMRSSVSLPLMAAPRTPFGVPGNFSMHAADKTKLSINMRILYIKLVNVAPKAALFLMLIIVTMDNYNY